MLNIYRNLEAIPNTIKNRENTIYDVDSKFDALIMTSQIKINNTVKGILKFIDKAEYLSNYHIKSRVGTEIDMTNISTGSKALILLEKDNYNNLGKPIVNITECGENAIELLFSMYAKNLLDENTRCLFTAYTKPNNFNKLKNLKLNIMRQYKKKEISFENFYDYEE